MRTDLEHPLRAALAAGVALLALAVAGCGKTARSGNSPPPATSAARPTDSSGTQAAFDCATLLTVADIARECHTGGAELALDPDGEEGVHREAIAVSAEHDSLCSRALRARGAPRMLLHLYILRYKDEDAPGLIAKAWRFTEDVNLRTHQDASYRRRDVDAIKGRFVFNMFETDPAGESALCSDDALRKLGAVLRDRLPAR